MLLECIMKDMVIFDFNFQQTSYKAIANPYRKGGNGCFRITVMNGELEKLLFGNNILSLTENRFLNNEKTDNPDLKELQQILLHTFTRHLQSLEKLAS